MEKPRLGLNEVGLLNRFCFFFFFFGLYIFYTICIAISNLATLNYCYFKQTCTTDVLGKYNFHQLPKYVKRLVDPLLTVFLKGDCETTCKQLKTTYEREHGVNKFGIPTPMDYLFDDEVTRRAEHWKNKLDIVSIATVCSIFQKFQNGEMFIE